MKKITKDDILEYLQYINSGTKAFNERTAAFDTIKHFADWYNKPLKGIPDKTIMALIKKLKTFKSKETAWKWVQENYPKVNLESFKTLWQL
jgi:hypothetical protein